MQTLGTYLKQLRTQQGLTQNQVASQIGLTGNSLISRIEAGRVTPSPQILKALADLYGQDVDALNTMQVVRDERHGVLREELLAMTTAAEASRREFLDAVDSILDEFDRQRDTLTNFLVASRMNLVWSLPRKMKRERSAQHVWILSPRLESEWAVPGIRHTVESNLRNGVKYRYLIPDTPTTLERARSLQNSFENLPIEFRIAPDSVFQFCVETVIYDPETDRRLGLMVAPTKQPEFDIVLGSDTASEFQVSFRKTWSHAQSLQ